MRTIVALLCGILFGAGLTVSDMINPDRVLSFLDLAGTWDPTLMFVMGGALITTALGYRAVLRSRAPLLDSKFHLPTAREIDWRLLGGAGCFGIGWGLAGICPGPAFADLATLRPQVLAFVAAMLAGMLAAGLFRMRVSAAASMRTQI